MLKKIKEYFAKKKQAKIEEDQKKANFEKAKQQYIMLQQGAMFLKYIEQDLQNQENGMNRATRRRIRQQIAKEGRFSQEIIDRYKEQVDNVLEYIAKEEAKKKEKK
jgi:histone H3/H4